MGRFIGKNGIKIDREPNFWQDPNDTEEAKRHITFAFGFYADGYFDRLPVIKKVSILLGYLLIMHRLLIVVF